MLDVKNTLLLCLSVFQSKCKPHSSLLTQCFLLSDCREHLPRLDSYFFLPVNLYFPVLELHTYDSKSLSFARLHVTLKLCKVNFHSISYKTAPPKNGSHQHPELQNVTDMADISVFLGILKNLYDIWS